jgi:hypothetical protein
MRRLRGPPGPPALGYHRPMNPEEAAHLLARLQPYGEQKKFEDAIRTIVRLAVLRATLDGYQQGYEDGKRSAVN